MKLEEKKTNKMFIIRRNTIIKLKVEIIKIERRLKTKAVF